jgi:chorismate dehydratase
LFSRTPIESIRTLALDEGSRTSIALVRILLAQRYGVEPDLLPLAIGASVDDARADAVLVIGDRAIQSPGGRFAEVWDLGEEWVAWTGKPFVFAMWVARPDVPLEELEEDLSLARDEGVAHLSEIAAREAAALGLTRPQCLSYLRDNLHFHFGTEERDGLQLFYDKAAELRLVPSGREVTYQR